MNKSNPTTGTGPGISLTPAHTADGMTMTTRLMENYQLLREYTQKDTQVPTGSHACKSACDPGAILGTLRRSREDTAEVIREVDEALAAIRSTAKTGGYAYKVEAFERHYIQGQTYEQIAGAMNSGRNSPARWCKEIMRALAVRLFGVNGIPK
ncbi:MAG: hypothetical protein UEP57_08075 [Oscillospiraceae bacterium]|nr:hypothetical protein [Oscillospiraceae bacterium]